MELGLVQSVEGRFGRLRFPVSRPNYVTQDINHRFKGPGMTSKGFFHNCR